MQKHFAKFKRGLAMFLVMLSLVGAVPLGAFDLTMIAGAIGDGDRGQSVRAMTGGSVGTHVGNWQADVGSTPFVRYSLVKFPNEANHPDQYEVLGQISVCDDKWKSILTAADSYWLGAPSGSYGNTDPTYGRPMTAQDYQVWANDSMDLYIYGSPRKFGFMTRSHFEALASMILPELAAKYGVDPNSEDYKEHYTWDASCTGKLICDFNTQGGTNAHIKQFGTEDSTSASGEVKVFKTGALFNAVVALCSVGIGHAAGNTDEWVEVVKTKGLNYAEFSQEGGQKGDKCGCSYRLLVEPGCTMIDKKQGVRYFGTARDLAMLAHIIDGPSMTESQGKIAWNQDNMTKKLLYLTNQSVPEYKVYSPKVLKDELGNGTQAEAVQKAIDARSGEQAPTFGAISQAEANKAVGKSSLKWYISNVFPKLSGYSSSDGVKGGAYSVSIISPTEVVPGSTYFTVKKTSNVIDGRKWQFTVELTDSSGAPVSGTFEQYTFTDGKCTFELGAGELAIFKGIPEGCKATVTEAPDPSDPDMKTTVNGQPGSTWSGDAVNTVTFDNSTDKPQDFTIQKTVTGTEGDKNKSWTFNVTFSKDITDGSYEIDGSSTPFSGTSCTVSLKDGQRAVFKNLPSNVMYDVTEVEADQDGYKTSPGAKISGSVAEQPLAKFTNDKGGGGGGGGGGGDILQKKDAFDGKNIGPATYLFTGIDTQWKSRYTTDANGSLGLQWSDPGGANYIKPGSYDVREVIAPVGYDLTEEVQEIQFLPDGKTHTGPLVFKNNKLKTITLLKKDPTGKDLDGAIFEVYRDGTYEGTVITQGGKAEYAGKNGQGLTDGYYEFVEIQSPAGYLIPKNNRVGVKVDSAMINGRDPIELSMVDYKVPTLKFLKYETGTTKGLAGAFFEVMVDGESVGEFGPTDESGEFEIPLDQISGVFEKQEDSWTLNVREVVGPEGYFIDDENWKIVEIDGGRETVEVPFYDTPYPEIKIYKRDTNTREPLPGATFDVQIDGASIGDKTTGEDGTITITWEEYGKFLRESDTDEEMFSVTVTEKTAPEGYTIDLPNTQTKPLKRGDKLLEFEFNDTKYPEIWVRKIDHETGKPLAGMTFDVMIDGKKLNAQFTTREEDLADGGWYKIKYEDYKEFLDTQGGWFTDERGYTVAVTETSAPQFYNRDRQLGSEAGKDYTIIRQLNSNSSRVEFTFEDTHYRSLKVIKIDAETNWELKGARFKLRCISLENQDLNASGSNPWSAGVEREGITNAEGFYVWDNLPNGDYELVETAPPQGYHGIDDTDSTLRGYWTDDRSTGAKHITITSGSGADGSGTEASDRVLEYTYANQPKSGLLIFKRDGLTQEPIEHAKFRVTPLAPLTGQAKEYETDANGMIIIEEDLTNGSYEIEEIYVPKPYNKCENTQIVQIDGTHRTYEKIFYNYPDMYVYAVKRDNVTGLPVPGAKFELREVGGGRVGDIVTSGENGFAMLGPVEPGKSYVIEEVQAPPGYLLTDPTWQTFKVPDATSNWSAEFEFVDNPKCDLWLRKVDAENSNKGLQGAEFQIRKASGQIVVQNAVTDNEGYIRIRGLEPGDYVAEELTPPVGYMLPESEKDRVTAIHLESGVTETILIKNMMPGGLVIRKVDAATHEALAGAEFQLYDINKKPLGGPVRTGADGYARWADLRPGQYLVEEITAPDGYMRTVEVKQFEVQEFRSIIYDWVNAEEATITIYKRDGETKTPLAGAEFEIRDLKGAVVDKLVTDGNGSATSKKLPLGYYQVVETKAPYGYQIVETKSDPVEVKAGTPVVLERVNWSDKTIIIRKRDVNTQQPLQGAWFELQSVDGGGQPNFSTPPFL